MTTTDRLQGLKTGLGLKAPCVVASTGNLTLSSTQVIDGIAVGSNQRVLVKDQTDLKENGVYTVAPAAWSRAKDFDGAGDAIPGTAVYVDRGSAGGGKFYAINSSSTSTKVVITHYVSSDADDKAWSLLSVALAGVSAYSQDTLLPLTTALAWRSSDGLSAAPDPFGSTSISSSAILAAAISSSAVTTAKIAGNAVTLAKMSTGTVGAMVAYSSLGSFGEVAPGSSGQVLTSRGAAIPPTMQFRGVVQVAFESTGLVAIGTTVIPFDDTVPQSTDGTQFLSQTITPQSTTNELLIEVILNAANSAAAGNWFTVALFQDSSADALAVVSQTSPGTNYGMNLALRHKMVPGSTVATTLKVRAGSQAAGTTTFNGQSTAPRFGGAMASSILITELGG